MMLLALIGSLASGPDFPVTVTATATDGVILTAGTTNTVWPLTNQGVVFSSNYLTGATIGGQYAITWPPNTLSVDHFTPEVCGYLNNTTTWRTNGTARFRAIVSSGGRTYGVALSLAIPMTAGTFSALYFSNYVSGTLGHHAITNIVARTNAGRTGELFAGYSPTGFAWNTNSLLYGLAGYSGISPSPNAGGTFTAITRRHIYTCAHTSPGAALTNGAGVGSVIYFTGTDGTTNAATITATRRRYYDNGYPDDDYLLGIVSADLPATVQPLPVAWATNVTSRLPLGAWTQYPPIPILETCQHGRVGSRFMTLFDGHQMRVGGDSGNPLLIVVSNSLVNYGGTSGTLLSSNFLADLNALTLEAGLDTNSYQPTIWPLTNFPNL
jgi:hypothetical protein